MEGFLITIALTAILFVVIQGEAIMTQEIIRLLANSIGMEMAAGVENIAYSIFAVV